MQINYNVTGSERKRLVQSIAEIMDCDAKYKGAPSFAYEVEYFTIDKNGVLSFDDNPDSEEIEKLLDVLAQLGFECEAYESTSEGAGLVIEMPKDDFTEAAIENLKRLVESKALLIKKALGMKTLDLEILDDTIRFPWFAAGDDANAVKAYTHFVTAICEMAKTQQRVNATEKHVDNEKYAFRCFLLRLGFIGSEYKAERKILLSKLSGSSAFKSPKYEVSEDAQ